LEDLYVFPRTFEQVYFVLYSLSPDIVDIDLERVEHAFAAFPWQGGYSAVGFYDSLKYATHRQLRPEIISIAYSSPGHIDLGLFVSVAMNIGFIVNLMAPHIKTLSRTYTDLYRDAQNRKLLRLKVKREEIRLSKAQMDFVVAANKKLADMMQIDDLPEIERRSGHPYRAFKILLSLFRRLRTLAEYKNTGKADFEE
jgi:hypothetical protein